MSPLIPLVPVGPAGELELRIGKAPALDLAVEVLDGDLHAISDWAPVIHLGLPAALAIRARSELSELPSSLEVANRANHRPGVEDSWHLR